MIKTVTFKSIISTLLCASMLLGMQPLSASNHDQKQHQSYYEWTKNGLKRGAQWTWNHKVEIACAAVVLGVAAYFGSQYRKPQPLCLECQRKLLNQDPSQLPASSVTTSIINSSTSTPTVSANSRNITFDIGDQQIMPIVEQGIRQYLSSNPVSTLNAASKVRMCASHYAEALTTLHLLNQENIDEAEIPQTVAEAYRFINTLSPEIIKNALSEWQKIFNATKFPITKWKPTLCRVEARLLA